MQLCVVRPWCRLRLLCSSLLPGRPQLGLADHVSVWPLSPGEPLGALCSAPSLLGAQWASHRLALAEPCFWGRALPPAAAEPWPWLSEGPNSWRGRPDQRSVS